MRRASPRALRGDVLALAGWAALACSRAELRGAGPGTIGETPRPAVTVAEWPPVATSPADAVDREGRARLRGRRADPRARVSRRDHAAVSGVQHRADSAGEPTKEARSGRADRRGRALPTAGAARRARRPRPPSATRFPDLRAASAPLRAGGAEGLQARHVGHMFLLTARSTRGPAGPELDVSDVRALEGH